MTRLRSCEGCSRHVFVTERVCPFCKRELAPAPAAPAVQFASGLSRAQRLALAAALASPGVAAAGCAKTDRPNDDVIVAGATAAGAGAGGATAGMGGVVTPVYGAPTPVYGAPAAGNPAPAPVAGGVAVPVYGVPIAGNPGKPPLDGGVDPDEDGGPIAVPVYGLPPPPQE